MSFKTRELWRDVPRYERIYQVSNLGSIRSLDRKIIHKNGHVVLRKGGLLKPRLYKNGYLRLELSKHGIRRKYSVHRLVALAFKPNHRNLPCVNHIDGDKTNNHEINLEWCTYRQNTQHAVDTGLLEPRRGEECNFSKITVKDVLKIIELLATNLPQEEIAKKFNITKSAVSSINTGKNWSNITGIIKSGILREKQVVNCRGETFSSMKEAADKFGIDKSNISKACSNIQKTAGKYPDSGERVKWSTL